MEYTEFVNKYRKDLLTQIINQEVYTYTCQYNGVKNTERDKTVSVGNASIDNSGNNHTPKHAMEKLLFSFTHLPAPHTQDIITFFKRIIRRADTKCK